MLPLSISEHPLGGLALVSVPQPADHQSLATPQRRKLLSAAQDFEAMLLAAWWEQMQNSFLTSADEEREAGAATLGWMGLQAMATAVAKAGGLGIADVLVKGLEPMLDPNKPAAQLPD